MSPLRSRNGFTMVETLLFFGIVGLMSTTLVAVSIATQEARVRQRYIAEAEQGGAQALDTIVKSIRKAESILTPASGLTGAILALGMTQNAEYPTIVAVSGGNLLLVQKETKSLLLSSRITIQNLNMKNVNETAVNVSFDVHTLIPTVPPKPYVRHFESTVGLFPDDTTSAGGCGTCPVPTCTSHEYRWSVCVSGTCTLSAESLAC
jgi:type II secretory pathway pseudopilin PulG